MFYHLFIREINLPYKDIAIVRFPIDFPLAMSIIFDLSINSSITYYPDMDTFCNNYLYAKP